MEVAQIDPNFTVYALFLLLYRSWLLFPPFLCFQHNLLHLTTFLILHQGFSTMKSTKTKPWAKQGRNQLPAGDMKTVMSQQGLLLPTSTARMTHHIHSPSPAALLSLPWQQAQAETLRDSKHFSSSSKKTLYFNPLPPQEKGWTPSTGKQTCAERIFNVILANFAWCLAETAACTTMKPSLLNEALQSLPNQRDSRPQRMPLKYHLAGYQGVTWDHKPQHI